MRKISDILSNMGSDHDRQDTRRSQDSRTLGDFSEDTQDYVASPLKAYPGSHDDGYRPKPETIKSFRRRNPAIDEDMVFQDAKHRINFEPGLAWNLMKGATPHRVRLVTAFVLSLYLRGYFQLDDPAIPQNTRARRMIIGIIKGKKKLALRLAGEYFYSHFPDMLELTRQNPAVEV